MTDLSNYSVGTAAERSVRALLDHAPLVFRSRMTPEEFHEFVLSHGDLRIERDKHGTITIHPPMSFDSGYYEGEGFFALKQWSKANKLGMAFSPSTSFDLPDGAELKADGAWISMDRVRHLRPEERKHIAQIVPDFIIEMRSETDRIAQLKRKITEGWIANGVRLAWLIDPIKERVWIYRADGSVEDVHGFNRVLSGEDVLPGFELNLSSLKEYLE